MTIPIPNCSPFSLNDLMRDRSSRERGRFGSYDGRTQGVERASVAVCESSTSIFPIYVSLFMLDLYDKDEADDLTSSDQRVLRIHAEDLVNELKDKNR